MRRAGVPRNTGVRSARQYSTEATALVYQKFGGPEVLKKEKITLGEPQANQVLVKMLAAPINPSDLNMVQGTYPIKASRPAIGGNEGVGVVQAVGSAVKDLKVNQRVVIAKAGLGTWTTHNLFNETDVDPIPDSVPVDYAAMLAINPPTALRLLSDFATLSEGDVVVQNCANSIVGQCVIQLAKARKLQTVNIIRERANGEDLVERLKLVGGTVVVNDAYAKTPAMQRLLSESPAPKLALNGAGGESATTLSKLLGNGGVMVTYGAMSRQPVTVASSALIFKDITLKGFWLQKWLDEHSVEERRAAYEQIVPLILNKDMVLFTEHFAFADAEKALAKSLTPFVERKVILRME